MNNVVPFILLLAIFPCTRVPAQTSENPALREWQEKWDNSLAYTLEVLTVVPADSLTFRPIDNQMTFHGQMRHLAGNIYGLSERFLDYSPDGYDKETIRTILQDETLTKPQLRALIEDAYAFGSAAVAALSTEQLNETTDFFAGPKTRRQIVYLLQDHATHHRAQTLVYLRLLGVRPPRYRGW